MKTTFPVTITGMNITERNVEGRYGSQDKVGITIQQTNVIDENGQNLVIPEGAWLNGFTPSGKMDQVTIGHTIPIQIKTKVNPNGGFYYNFGYYPKDGTPSQTPTPATAAPAATTPSPVAPTPEYVTKEEFHAAISELREQIDPAF